ncbi:MAG: glycosyltransferase, partial [Candidatus Marinimicrobia bacterium]|nr:glycosyltransferase [Candidatus Neomarinimicrobiota bacterium]
LPRLLAALAAQDYPADQLKITIVDDNSTDDSWAILARAAASQPDLQIHKIVATPPGWGPKKWALAEGLRLSEGEIILTTDADCRPGPQWVSAMAARFTDGVGLVIGPAPVAADKGSAWREALFLESSSLDALAAGGAARGLPLTCTGRNLAYRRSIFDELGGFDGIAHLVSGDDDLLMHKITASGQWQVTFALESNTIVPSPPPEGLGGFIRQRLRHASKGLIYLRVPASCRFRLTLPLFLLANMVSLAALALTFIGAGVIWPLLFLAKLAAEGLLVYRYLGKLGLRVRLWVFIITGILHPIYVVIIGILGNFYKLSWKERDFRGSTV